MFVYEHPVNQKVAYTPDGVSHILISERFLMRRDFTGYYIRRRGDVTGTKLGEPFNPEKMLDRIEYLLKHEVDDKHEEVNLVGSLWLRKRPQIIDRFKGKGRKEELVSSHNVGIYTLVDKSDMTDFEYYIRPKQLLQAIHRLTLVPEELLRSAPNRTQFAMWNGGHTIRAGQKMGGSGF